MINAPIISGIICEFNPLHNGHRLILQQMKRHGLVVCAMSGNFVQRGEPALLDKWTRTRLALLNGADLVLELPLSFATARAERFALGGVGLLNALGCVNRLWFGSESGDVAVLGEIAALLEENDCKKALREELSAGLSFAAAREAAVARVMGGAYRGQLRESNNILGIEYLKAIRVLQAPLLPHTISRQGAAHDSPSQEALMSAMEIRRQITAGKLPRQALPENTSLMLEQLLASGACPALLSRLESAMLAKLRGLSLEDFAALPDVSEGLENRLYKAARSAGTLEAFYAGVKSKRYSHARIRRLALYAFLGVTEQPLSYLRILGMNQNGEQILKRANPTLPILGKSADIRRLSPAAQNQFALEARGDDLWALSLPKPLPCGMDYTMKMIKL